MFLLTWALEPQEDSESHCFVSLNSSASRPVNLPFTSNLTRELARTHAVPEVA